MSKLWGMDDLEAAWIDLHDANAKLRWFVGNPAYEPRGQVGWSQHAFNPRERPSPGRTEEWTAVGPTEEACVRAMARYLWDVGESASQWSYGTSGARRTSQARPNWGGVDRAQR